MTTGSFSVQTPPAGRRPSHLLRRALPAADVARLVPDLETSAVKPRQVVHTAGETLKHAYFPNGGVFSGSNVKDISATLGHSRHAERELRSETVFTAA